MFKKVHESLTRPMSVQERKRSISSFLLSTIAFASGLSLNLPANNSQNPNHSSSGQQQLIPIPLKPHHKNRSNLDSLRSELPAYINSIKNGTPAETTTKPIELPGVLTMDNGHPLVKENNGQTYWIFSQGQINWNQPPSVIAGSLVIEHATSANVPTTTAVIDKGGILVETGNYTTVVGSVDPIKGYK